MNFFDYEEMKRAEDECKKILDKCKASEAEIKKIYENANETLFEVIDEFRDRGVIYALKFSLIHEIAEYIKRRFDKPYYVCNYNYGKFAIYIDGEDVLDYEFFKNTH